MTSSLVSMIAGFSCFMLAPCSAANTFKAAEELKLRDYLLPARDRLVLPVLDRAEKAKFAINLTIQADHILDMTVDSNGVLWLDMILCMNWNASSLMWDPRDFNNVTYTAFYTNFVWSPILEVHEIIIPQSAFAISQYWKFRMVSWNGYTEFCPQVHMPLSCAIEESYDAFPAEEFNCNAVIKDVSPMSHIQHISINEGTSPGKAMRSFFTGSGFELLFLQREQGKNSAMLRAAVRRNSRQWMNSVTVPVILIGLLSCISLWLPDQTPTRTLLFCFALIAILLLQIQLYSRHLMHCSKPPTVLSLLGQLVVGQLLIGILVIFEVSLENSDSIRRLYAQLDFVYSHSVVHKYAEWTRVNFFGWAFEKFDEEVDPNESQKNPQEETPMSFLFFAGITIRFFVTVVSLYNILSFCVMLL
ncbi:5-hydroxytryptamine receptor 3A [Galendromus occidentalis]|uniref:5-hydroxytryptamine receptor 3A n=1 Tax=Galendromus occidentalis TaxID=34638 RepID=A0AAJ7SEG1_9ACAR|nr:5-hydroxytryptamine receptor 3A [Galendromus occidentalis]